MSRAQKIFSGLGWRSRREGVFCGEEESTGGKIWLAETMNFLMALKREVVKKSTKTKTMHFVVSHPIVKSISSFCSFLLSTFMWMQNVDRVTRQRHVDEYRIHQRGSFDETTFLNFGTEIRIPASWEILRTIGTVRSPSNIFFFSPKNKEHIGPTSNTRNQWQKESFHSKNLAGSVEVSLYWSERLWYLLGRKKWSIVIKGRLAGTINVRNEWRFR